MKAEVTPEPTDDEREAILVALDPAADSSSARAEDAWRRAGLHEAVEREAAEHPHP